MNDDETRRRGGELLVNLFSGVGLGLLLGIIVGLSVTPVVSVVVGALTSLLAVFLGLEGGADSKLAALGNTRLNGVRIGSFGFATVFGLLLGLYIRIQDPFAVSIQQHMQRWLDADFTREEAKIVVMYQNAGLKPEGVEVVAGVTDHKKPVLYGVLEDIDACNRLNPQRYGDDPEEILGAFRNYDTTALGQIADQVDEMPKDVQLKVLTMVHKIMCDS
ncbi:MAG: hypothetical protein U9Q81_01720 [Pseudomonadota bacterium]|nr:hypothetical protein [Pseudomonadota bacterium]